MVSTTWRSIARRLILGDYLREAEFHGLAIAHVLETHNHADHVSGHGRLAAATGARIHVHRAAGATYPHEPIEDGWELVLGDAVVRALHVPGHRPEHTVFAVIDASRSPEPWALLTGDSLFVGDVARPDLAVEARSGATDLFRSLHAKLLSLPPHVEVWPGHIGGSMCGSASMSSKTSSTLGFELAHNAVLGLGEAEFVEELVRRIGPPPPNLERIVARNRGELLPGGEPAARSLAPRQLEAVLADGGLLVDVRPWREFANGHVPGAIALSSLEGGFAAKLAMLAGGEEVFFVGESEAEATAAIALAEDVALPAAGGFLRGGMAAWMRSGREVRRAGQIEISELHRRFEAGPAQILDVRDSWEVAAGRIEGSAATPWYSLKEVPEPLDPERPIVTVCASGRRAGIAASLLRRGGARDVVSVAGGGVADWAASGWPMQADRARR